ncbi:MAG: hypothetical protein QOG51_1340 [Verrucomicrobiota bacterium]
MVTEMQQVLSQLKTVEDENKRSTDSLKETEKQLEKLRKELGAREARLQATQEKLKEADARIAGAKDQVAPLLEENCRLAASLEQVTVEVEQLRKLGAQLRGDLDKATAEANSANAARKEVTDRARALEKERTSLQSRLDFVDQQLTSQGKVAILPASEVAKMTDELVSQLQVGFGGLRVRDGELKLKVAFAGAGKKAGFIVPTTESDPKLKESLQELTIRFDKSEPSGAE